MSDSDRLGQLVRSCNPAAFRSGQWGLIVGVALLPPGRANWLVEWPDGVQDYWVQNDPPARYQFARIEEPEWQEA